jgi:hypothetical protein
MGSACVPVLAATVPSSPAAHSPGWPAVLSQGTLLKKLSADPLTQSRLLLQQQDAQHKYTMQTHRGCPGKCQGQCSLLRGQHTARDT